MNGKPQKRKCMLSQEKVDDLRRQALGALDEIFLRQEKMNITD